MNLLVSKARISGFTPSITTIANISVTSVVRYRTPLKFERLAHKKVSVILTRDVDKIGVKGQKVEVFPGFARNFLFPMKLADYPTPENQAKVGPASEEAIKQMALRKVQQQARGKISKIKVNIDVKNNNGKLAAAVTPQKIREKLYQQHLILLDISQILSQPLTTFGIHDVSINFERTEMPLKVEIFPFPRLRSESEMLRDEAILGAHAAKEEKKQAAKMK